MPASTASASTIASRLRRRALVTMLLLGSVVAPARADDLSVTLEEARAAWESGRALLIDIREPNEHATGVAAGALLLPMSQIGRRLAEIPVAPDKPVLLICNTQNRSSRTLKALRERGYGHVRFVNGGMSEWAKRGWPMVAPPR